MTEQPLTDAAIKARLEALSGIDEPVWGDLQEALGHAYGYMVRALCAEAAVLKAPEWVFWPKSDRHLRVCPHCAFGSEQGHAPDCLRAEVKQGKVHWQGKFIRAECRTPCIHYLGHSPCAFVKESHD